MASAGHKQPVDLYINCVVLSPFHSEFTFLHNVFRLTGIRMHHAESLVQAEFLLTVTGSTVLLVDVIFADGTWRTALDLFRDSYPLVTTLVMADPADRPFLKDLFHCGACGILWKPFQFDGVRRLIRAAHGASRERQALREEALREEILPEEILSRSGNSGDQRPRAPIAEIRSPRFR
jgi:DNA-binding NtrC family response regulator